jgi:hypothetical protein
VNRIAWALLVLCHFTTSGNAQANLVAGQALSTDGCVLHYTTDLPRIERFNICSGQPLSDFNQSPLPDPRGAKQIQVLPDGGILVANVSVIARYQPNGTLAITYDSPNEDCWAGVALEKDAQGFWASSSCHDGVVRFSLNSSGQMIGGGTTYTSSGVQVNHGLDLHCDLSLGPNYLQVTWSGGNVFFMQKVGSLSCTGSPFNSISGTGTGTVNGQTGATIEWSFTDAAQASILNDSAVIVIKNAAGEKIVDTAGKLFAGGQIVK